jgi:hypothetical protein
MITSEWPDAGSARPTHFIRRQAEYLTAAGVAVDVFTFHGGKNPLNYLAAWGRVRPRLEAGRYDLIHAQFGQSGLLALPRRLPLVVTFRLRSLGIIMARRRRHAAGPCSSARRALSRAAPMPSSSCPSTCERC